METVFPIFFVLFIFIITYVVVSASRKSDAVVLKSKYSSLSSWSSFLIIIAIFALAGLTITSIGVTIDRNSTDGGSESVADGFTIEDYEVILNVDKDYSIDVTENITVNFTEAGHHGIYKFIPYWLQYTDKNGDTQSRKAIVSDITSDEQFSLDRVKKKERIRIGSPNTTLPTGLHDYSIHYTYDMGGDIYDGFDEFIFHAFGDYWGTRINNARVVIILPDDVDGSEIRFFADKKRKNDITDQIITNVSGNTITAEVKADYNLRKALTVDVVLPDGFFNDSELDAENYGYSSLILCMICVLFALMSFVLWLRYGKDLPDVPETVEFYPPAGLDAAELGYIHKADTGKKLTVATIISLASKEYIKISENSDKTDITITRNVGLSFDKAINREIKIVKLKDFDADTAGADTEAINFMNTNFHSKKTKDVVIRDNIDQTIANISFLLKNDYLKIESDTINDYTDEAVKNIRKDIEKKNKKEVTFTEIEEKVFNALFEEKDEVVLSEHKTFYTVFSDVANIVRNKYDDIINDIDAHKATVISALWLIICIALWGIAYCFIKDLNPALSFVYLVGYAANVISLVFTIMMKRKTQLGEELTAKINGFKNYIEVARKDQIEMLVEENPNYFYDILPYAYVLDVSKKWVEKFENIPIPVKDSGSFDYMDIDVFDNISSSVYVPSSGGGGGGCGGGCSSCGGGCSSCGGGGSW